MNTSDGAYAIYPVQSSDVLIEDCTVSGASDSGIYVGQSQDIVVRNNTATLNVAGIEIENSFDADVYGNDSHDNTAGILVFDLPGLQQEGGHAIRVFSNTIVNNNLASFAAQADIVSLVPAGTGFFVMANHDVEIFGNTISGNQTAAAGIISYAITQMSFTGSDLLRVAVARVPSRQQLLRERDEPKRAESDRAPARLGSEWVSQRARSGRHVGRNRRPEHRRGYDGESHAALRSRAPKPTPSGRHAFRQARSQ